MAERSPVLAVVRESYKLVLVLLLLKISHQKKRALGESKKTFKNSTRLLQNSTVSQVLFEYLVEKAQRKVVGIFLLIIRNS